MGKLFKKSAVKSSFLAGRAVFQNKPPEGGSEKPVEKPGEKKETEKKAESYTVDDLHKARTDAEFQLIAKIAHPDVLNDAKAKLATKLNPLEAKLNQLETEKTAERMQVKTEVEKAVQETLQEKYTFKDMQVEYGGKMFKFVIEPPLPVEQFDKMQSKALASLEYADKYADKVGREKAGDVAKGSTSMVNGTVSFSITLDRTKPAYKNMPENAYIAVVFDGNKVVENYSSPKLDEEKIAANDFLTAFKAWQNDPASSGEFVFGSPPKKCNLGALLKDVKGDKSAVTMDLIMNKNALPSDISNLAAADNMAIRSTIVYGENGHVVTTSETNHLLTPDRVDKRTAELNERKELVRSREYDEIVNQQRRHIKTVTNYWPLEAGQKEFKLKKQQVYEDGIVTSEASFDRNGQLTERKSSVRGCDGITAVDRPSGSGKKIPLLDDDGKPMTDEIGRPKGSENETTRVMMIKTKDGKEISIKSYEAMKKERGANFTTEDYMKFLSQNLRTKEEFHAFTQLMFKYRSDRATHNVEDYWQKPDETAKATENGMMLGDCEDYAFFMRRILEFQGKKAYVLGVPGHAECVSISRDKNGKYHAMSYGTFGVDENGNRVGEKADAAKSTGYDTPELALKSLQAKWHVQNSGNEKMQDGRLFHGPFNDLQIMEIHSYGPLPPNTVMEGENKPESQGVIDQRIFIKGKAGELGVNAREEPTPAAEAKAAPKVQTEAPEITAARNKMAAAGRSVMRKYVGKSYTELQSMPDLGKQIGGEIQASVQALVIKNVRMAVALPGGIRIENAGGAISVKGADAYAAMILSKKKEIEEGKKAA